MSINENFLGGDILLDAKMIGERIKEKLTEHGYKQKELIEKTGISKAAISNYMNGNRVPDTESVLKISNILETSVEWLLTGRTTNENLTPEEKNIINAYRNSDSRTKEIIKLSLEPYNQSRKLSESKIG